MALDPPSPVLLTPTLLPLRTKADQSAGDVFKVLLGSDAARERGEYNNMVYISIYLSIYRLLDLSASCVSYHHFPLSQDIVSHQSS